MAAYAVQTGREQGLKSGEYLVTVEANERPTELRSQDGGPPAVGKRITPPWYSVKQTSGLRYTVEGGRNTINLELTSPVPERVEPQSNELNLNGTREAAALGVLELSLSIFGGSGDEQVGP